MDRDNLLLIILFSVVIILGGVLFLFDPSSIGKEGDSNTSVITETKKPTLNPIQQQPQLVIEKNRTEPTPLEIPVIEPVLEPINQSIPVEEEVIEFNQSNPKNHTYIPPMILTTNQTVEPPKVDIPLPTTDNSNEVCDTMCKFRDSMIDRVASLDGKTMCYCKNGYQRAISLSS
jgi:hypothetical protein